MAESDSEPDLDEMTASTEAEEFLSSLLTALGVSPDAVCHIDGQGCIWQEIDGQCVKVFCP